MISRSTMGMECIALGLFVTHAVSVRVFHGKHQDHPEKVEMYQASCRLRVSILYRQYLIVKSHVSQMKSWLISISYIKPSGLRGVTVGMTLKQPR